MSKSYVRSLIREAIQSGVVPVTVCPPSGKHSRNKSAAGKVMRPSVSR